MPSAARGSVRGCTLAWVLATLGTMKTRTVFILGAGSSEPYGITTGKTLPGKVADAVAAIGSQAEITYSHPRNGGASFSLSRVDSTLLANRIRRSRTPTIDTFIDACSEEEAGRIVQGMISVIWQEKTDAAKRTERKDGDWLSWLYHTILSQRLEEFAKNQIVFVSFNYDRLPRLLLATMMANTYAYGVKQSWLTVGQEVATVNGRAFQRFQHLNGSILHEPRADEQERVLDPAYALNDLRAATKNIRPMGGHPSEKELSDLRELWGWAERICFLGLGYHDELMRQLGLTREFIDMLIRDGKFVGGTGYELGDLERRAVRARVGPSFQLAPSYEDCIAFLQREVRSDEEVAALREGMNFAE